MADALTYEDRPYAPLDEEDAAEVAEGLADFEAGRVISDEAVRRWVKSLATESPLPPPECGD